MSAKVIPFPGRRVNRTSSACFVLCKGCDSWWLPEEIAVHNCEETREAVEAQLRANGWSPDEPRGAA